MTQAVAVPPYSYDAKLEISLWNGGARFDLSVRNTAPDALSFGMGLHPYFPREPRTRLRLPAERLTCFDPDGLPRQEEPVPDALDYSALRHLPKVTLAALWLSSQEAQIENG